MFMIIFHIWNRCFNLPKVLSKILLYMIADDFLWTILWVIAWYFFVNSFSLWVDSIDADLFSGIFVPMSVNVNFIQSWKDFTIESVLMHVCNFSHKNPGLLLIFSNINACIRIFYKTHGSWLPRPHSGLNSVSISQFKKQIS